MVGFYILYGRANRWSLNVVMWISCVSVRGTVVVQWDSFWHYRSTLATAVVLSKVVGVLAGQGVLDRTLVEGHWRNIMRVIVSMLEDVSRVHVAVEDSVTASLVIIMVVVNGSKIIVDHWDVVTRNTTLVRVSLARWVQVQVGLPRQVLISVVVAFVLRLVVLQVVTVAVMDQVRCLWMRH